MAWWDKLGNGKTLTRTTVVLAIATTPIFNVAGGRIILRQIIGAITTIIGGAANVFLQANPTVGTATTTALCAALNINAFAVGNALGITGVPVDAMLPAANASVVPGMTMPVIIQIGTIDFVCDAAPGGAVQWTIKWEPLDDIATIAAA